MNLPTILIGLIVLLLFAVVLVRLIGNLRKGKYGCGCGCDGCPSSAYCHRKEEKET